MSVYCLMTWFACAASAHRYYLALQQRLQQALTEIYPGGCTYRVSLQSCFMTHIRMYCKAQREDSGAPSPPSALAVTLLSRLDLIKVPVPLILGAR